MSFNLSIILKITSLKFPVYSSKHLNAYFFNSRVEKLVVGKLMLENFMLEKFAVEKLIIEKLMELVEWCQERVFKYIT